MGRHGCDYWKNDMKIYESLKLRRACLHACAYLKHNEGYGKERSAKRRIIRNDCKVIMIRLSAQREYDL